jgi:uncharacterized repeat protein (TIGR01451 family)
MKKFVPFLFIFLFLANKLQAQNSNNPVILRVVTSETATHVNATILAYNFDKIVGFQFSVVWNPSVVSTPTYTSVLSELQTNFDNNGTAKLIWVSPTSLVTGLSNTPLINLVFAKTGGSQQPNINIANIPLAIEFVGDDLKVNPYIILANSSDDPSIKGRVFIDNNKDCQINMGDLPLPNRIIKASNPTEGDFYGFTDKDGNYGIYLLNNNLPYSLSTLVDSTLWESCQPNVIVQNPSLATSQSVDFILKPKISCPINTVKVNNNILRRCFSTNAYHINAKNEGTMPSQNTYVIVNIDKYMTIESATLPFSTLGNQQFRFDLGTLDCDDVKDFVITVKLDCDSTILGQIHCVKAEIFPKSNCESDQPRPFAKATCENNKVKFNIENQGLTPLVGANYIVIEDDMIFNKNVLPALNPMGIFNTEVTANGSTWRLEVRSNDKLLATTFAEGCGINQNGKFSTGFVEIFKQIDPSKTVSENCRASVGAYDPNDKQGFPKGKDASHFIEQNTPIDYLIRFQNTGTDTAFNVIVEDVIDNTLLDISTLKILGASHNMSLDIKNRNNLVFNFKNIMLPDSFKNEKLSHGFVQFSIQQNRNVSLGSVIKNKAAIFFDFNAPIITNETFHTIGKDLFLIKSQDILLPNVDVKVVPNPMFDNARIEILGLEQNGTLKLDLIDMLGRTVLSKISSENNFYLQKDELPDAGVFVFKIYNEKQGLIAVGKIIVKS